MNREKKAWFTVGFLLMTVFLLFPEASWHYVRRLLSFLRIFWLMGSGSEILWTALGSYLLVVIFYLSVVIFSVGYKVWRAWRTSRIEREEQAQQPLKPIREEPDKSN